MTGVEITAEPVRSFEDFYRAEWASVRREVGFALGGADLAPEVVLRFSLDWSVEQIAVGLGVAPGTVKSRLHRALRRLEKTLGEPR